MKVLRVRADGSGRPEEFAPCDWESAGGPIYRECLPPRDIPCELRLFLERRAAPPRELLGLITVSGQAPLLVRLSLGELEDLARVTHSGAAGDTRFEDLLRDLRMEEAQAAAASAKRPRRRGGGR